MTLLANDRDLLTLEPTLFIHASAAGTRVLALTDAQIAGTSLSSATMDFEAAGVAAGQVAVIHDQDTAVEIVQRTAPDELEVSLPRSAHLLTKIPPGDGTGLSISIVTFERLIAQSQEWALWALGLDPEHPTMPLNTQSILNPASVRRAICVRCISLAFEQAAALDPEDPTLAARAALYSSRAAAAAGQVIALIDRDGDGSFDETRRLDTATLVRR